MKKTIYILLFYFLGNALVAQNKLTNAIYHFKQNELDKAKELIDAAVDDTLFSDKSSTWYYRGTIYKELFKSREAENKKSPSRQISVESFKTALKLEKEGTYADYCQKSLVFLAQTIYNHSATSFDPQNYELAIEYYNQYKDIISFVEPETDFKEKDIMFNLALATTYGRISEEDTTKRDEYLQKAKKLYEEVLKMEPNNISANYNLGIIYYNEGVEIVNNMDYSLDLFELNAVQDKIIELFRQSLPYMLKAYELNPRRKETLIGLQGIYFSLNDIEKSEDYKRQLEALDGAEPAEAGGGGSSGDDNSPKRSK